MTKTLAQIVSFDVDAEPGAFNFHGVTTDTGTPVGPSPPVAILVTVGDDRRAAEQVIGDLRARTDLLAYAPVLVIDADATPANAWAAFGADQVLSAPPAPALLDAWTIEPNAAIPRLVELFGQSSILPLLHRFRGSLLALRGTFADGEAHQVAGLAGTLGYQALSSACEAVQDDPAMIDVALREVRKAIYDVSQHLERLAAP